MPLHLKERVGVWELMRIMHGIDLSFPLSPTHLVRLVYAMPFSPYPKRLNQNLML